MLFRNTMYSVFVRAVEKECYALTALIVIITHVPYARLLWCVIGDIKRIDKQGPGGFVT